MDIIENTDKMKVASPEVLKDKILLLKQSRNLGGVDYIRFAVRKLSPVIIRSIKYLSYKLDCHQVLIARAAVEYGIGRLWGFREIKQLKKAYERIYETDKEKLRYVKMGEFDLGTSEGEPKDYSFSREIMSQVNGLAEKLGIPSGTVFKLTLMAGLIESEKIDVGDSNIMAEVLKKFVEKLRSHVAFVQNLQKDCEKKAKDGAVEALPKKITLCDIYPEKSIKYEQLPIQNE